MVDSLVTTVVLVEAVTALQPTVLETELYIMQEQACTVAVETPKTPQGRSWTTTKGFAQLTIPVYFSPENEVGRDILPLLSKAVKEVYIDLRDMEAKAQALLNKATEPEQRAYYRGQIALMTIVRANFQAIQRQNKGLVNWTLAPENAEKVKANTKALHESVENRLVSEAS